MRTKFEKTMRITSDLLSYCHHHGASEFNVSIVELDDCVSYVVHARNAVISDWQLEVLQKSLDAPRQRDVEQDYWELMGDSEDYSELTLIGMSCDEAEVKYENGELTIRLKRLD